MVFKIVLKLCGAAHKNSLKLALTVCFVLLWGMRCVRFKSRFFISLYLCRGQKYLFSLFLYCSLLALPGCLTTGKSDQLAPSLPVRGSVLSYEYISMLRKPRYFSELSIPTVYPDFVGSNFISRSSPLMGGILAVSEQDVPVTSFKKCRLKDRFDRKALIAYEWDRSRLSLDVDGVNLRGGDKSIRVEYKLRFQPEKTRAQRCRYPSKFQGLIGSGYNEIVIRKEDTVWSELRDMKREALDYIDHVF